MVFVHGEGTDLRGRRERFDEVRSAVSERGFVNLKERWGQCFLRCFGAKDTLSVKLCARLRDRLDHIGFSAADAEELAPKEAAGDDATAVSCVLTPCCAEFAVSRAQVRARPREFYEQLLELVYSPMPSDGCGGHFCCREWCHDLEHLWHIIFGMPRVMSAQSCPRAPTSVSSSIIDGLGGQNRLEEILGPNRMPQLPSVVS